MPVSLISSGSRRVRLFVTKSGSFGPSLSLVAFGGPIGRLAACLTQDTQRRNYHPKPQAKQYLR